VPSAHREEHVGGAVLTRASPLPDAGSSWARVAATGRVAAPRPPGVRVALTIGHGRLGLWRAAARRTSVRSVQRGAVSALAPAPRARRGHPRVRGRQSSPPCSSCTLAACTSGTCRGLGRFEGLVVRRTAHHGAARPPARAEHVRARTPGGALRAPGTRPVTPRTLGARVVGVLGPPAGV